MSPRGLTSSRHGSRYSLLMDRGDQCVRMVGRHRFDPRDVSFPYPCRSAHLVVVGTCGIPRHSDPVGGRRASIRVGRRDAPTVCAYRDEQRSGRGAAIHRDSDRCEPRRCSRRDRAHGRTRRLVVGYRKRCVVRDVRSPHRRADNATVERDLPGQPRRDRE